MLDLQSIQDQFGHDIMESSFRDNRRIVVPSDRVYFVLETLWRDWGFDTLMELTAADYLEYPKATDRFGVMYVLVNSVTGERIVVKAICPAAKVMLLATRPTMIAPIGPEPLW